MMLQNAAALEDWRQFLTLAPNGMVQFTADGAIIFRNPAAARLFRAVYPGESSNIYEILASYMQDMRARVSGFSENTGIILDHVRVENMHDPRCPGLFITLQRLGAYSYVVLLTETAETGGASLPPPAEQKLQAIYENIRDYAIFSLSPDGMITGWNSSMQNLGEWRADQLEGRHVSMLIPGNDSQEITANLMAKAVQHGVVKRDGVRLHSDGSQHWASLVAAPVRGTDGAVEGFVLLTRAQPETTEADEKLKAYIDPFTGAYNLKYGQEKLRAAFERRAKDGYCFAVLMVELDNMAQLTRQFGEANANSVLYAVVRACKNELRSGDVVARWGQQEFLIFLPGITTPIAAAVAERLRKVAAELRVTNGKIHNLTATISAGVAGVEENESNDIVDLFRRVENALHSAKVCGRNRVVLAAEA